MYKNQTSKNSQKPLNFFKTVTQSTVSITQKKEQRVASKMKNYPATMKKPNFEMRASKAKTT